MCICVQYVQQESAHFQLIAELFNTLLGSLLFVICNTSLGQIIICLHMFSYHCYADDAKL